MNRLVIWLLVFGLGMLLGRMPVPTRSAASSEEANYLREVAARQETLIATARERYERSPKSFLAASRLALLLSVLRENQQQQQQEFGVRVDDPVYEPELRMLIRHCGELAHRRSEQDLVRGLEARTRRQDFQAAPAG